MEAYKKLFEIQNAIGKIGKDGDNPYFSSSYLTLKKLLEKVKPILKEKNVVISQSVGYSGDNQPTLHTVFIDLDSSNTIEADMLLMCKSTDPQAQGSAVTYARRYQLMALLAIVPSETDDDGNAASPAPIEKAMNQTQWTELGKLLDEKGIKSREDKITLVRALAGDNPLNTSAYNRLAKEIKEAQSDTLQNIIIEKE